MTYHQQASRGFAMTRILGAPMLALVILLAVGAGYKPAPLAPSAMPAQAAQAAQASTNDAGAVDTPAATPREA